MNVVFNFKLEETPFYYYFLGAHTSLLMIRNQEVASLFARIDVKLRGSHFFFLSKKLALMLLCRFLALLTFVVEKLAFQSFTCLLNDVKQFLLHTSSLASREINLGWDRDLHAC